MMRNEQETLLATTKIHNSYKVTKALKGSYTSFDKVVVTQDGKYLIAGNSSIKIWDYHTLQQVNTIFLGHNGPSMIGISNNSPHIWAMMTDWSSYQFSISSFNFLNGHLITEIDAKNSLKRVGEGYKDNIYDVIDKAIITSDDKYMVALCKGDGFASDPIKVYDIENKTLIKSSRDIDKQFYIYDSEHLLLSKDESKIIFNSGERILICDFFTFKIQNDIKLEDNIKAMSLLSNDRFLVALTNKVLFLNINTGETLSIIECYDTVQNIAVSNDMKYLAIARESLYMPVPFSTLIDIYDLTTHSLTKSIRCKLFTINDITFSVDSKNIIVVGQDMSLKNTNYQEEGKNILIINYEAISDSIDYENFDAFLPISGKTFLDLLVENEDVGMINFLLENHYIHSEDDLPFLIREYIENR